MDEQYQNSDEIEVAPLDNVQDESQQSDEPQIDAEAQRREAAKDRDFRALRQRQKELEWENKRKDEMLQQLLQQQQSVRSPQPEPEPDEPDDDFIPAGKVKGIARRTVQPLERKIQELENKLAQQEQQNQYGALRGKYSDFDDVVNVETLEILEKHEPELASTIAAFKDPYKMGLHAYKYIKALGLADQIPDSRRKKEVNQKLERNAKAVQSPAVFDKRPMAQAFKVTQAESTRLYEEMMHYASKANGL